MRLLFFHNTLPEYRIEFWNQLSELCDLTVAIIEPELESKVYGFEVGAVHFSTLVVNKGQSNLQSIISDADAVVLPPIDDLRCVKETFDIKRICKRNKVPFYFWTEKWEAPKEKTPIKKRIKNSIQRELFKICSSGAKRYIASGTKAKEYLEVIGVPQNKIGIAIDSSTSPDGERIDIREKYEIEEDKKIILYLGRLIKRKGCDVLIRACKDSLNTWNAVLLVCGDGKMMDECKTLAEGSKNIIFAGKVQPSVRRSYYEQSDLFVLPSVITDGIIEGWGLSVNEALECGTPVVVTDAVGAGYDLIDMSSGIVVRQGDLGDLKDGICGLINRTSDRDKCKEKYRSNSVEMMSVSFMRNIETKN